MYYYKNYNNIRLTDIFQDNPGNPVPECHYSGFIEAEDGGGDSDNWSCMTCKAPVKRHHQETNN